MVPVMTRIVSGHGEDTMVSVRQILVKLGETATDSGLAYLDMWSLTRLSANSSRALWAGEFRVAVIVVGG